MPCVGTFISGKLQSLLFRQGEIKAAMLAETVLPRLPTRSCLGSTPQFKVKNLCKSALCKGALLEAPVPPHATLSPDQDVPVPAWDIHPYLPPPHPHSCWAEVVVPCPALSPLQQHRPERSPAGGDGAPCCRVLDLGRRDPSPHWGAASRRCNRGAKGQAQPEALLQETSCTHRRRHRDHRPTSAMFASCPGLPRLPAARAAGARPAGSGLPGAGAAVEAVPGGRADRALPAERGVHEGAPEEPGFPPRPGER